MCVNFTQIDPVTYENFSALLQKSLEILLQNR